MIQKSNSKQIRAHFDTETCVLSVHYFKLDKLNHLLNFELNPDDEESGEESEPNIMSKIPLRNTFLKRNLKAGRKEEAKRFKFKNNMTHYMNTDLGH